MRDCLRELGLAPEMPGGFHGEWLGSGAPLVSLSPIDGQPIAAVRVVTSEDYESIVARALEAFRRWRRTPAPQRGGLIRELGNALRAKKPMLAELVTLEMGKIRSEAEGEVQEMIDICDFAVGLSRQLYGQTMHSERPDHRMYEQWHPLGLVAIVTAFNFPVAVWSWNSILAAVCGNSTLWKPSSQTPLTAIATIKIAHEVCRRQGVVPALFSLAIGDRQVVGEAIMRDRRIPLVSATGSCAMGRTLAQGVAERLGRSLLELGGNNAVIVTPSADRALAVRALVFGAVGTAGQRCTSTRRVFVHRSIYRPLVESLQSAYASVRIGNPMAPETLMGPLIDRSAVDSMMLALEQLRRAGGRVLFGGDRLEGHAFPGGCYVTPCLAEAAHSMAIVREETFAPILYLIEYDALEDAIAMQNDVPQGLSSAIFTQDLAEAEQFLSCLGSDCGIANVNLGTSGAEIGGAFGGEKETGGGRESGSDSWKSYMRRQTNTINFGKDLPLAQGVRFE